MSYSGTILGDSPKRYYRLGETTVTNGSSATDSSTSAQNGTYTGSDISSVAGLLSGDSDKAISFTSSSSSYVSVPTTGMPTGAGAWSMECWIKTPSSFTGTEPTFMMIGSTATNTGAFLIYEPTDQKIELWDWNGSVVNATSTTATSTIYYICATYDGTTAKLYIGTSGGSVSLQGSATKTYAIAYGTVTVGADRTSGDYWSGVIDEAAFYTVALTSTQVTAHFNAGNSSVTTSSRTVTSTVALKTSSSHAISASAALRVTSSRSVSDKVALLVSQSPRTITASATLLTTKARTISCSAVLLVVKSRTIPDTSALRVTFSRSVLSTVALAAIRTVSCSTALLTKQSRTASATATLLVTPTRTVGSNTAVILVTSKRSVTSTVALRQTDARSIGATSAILVTSHRTTTTRTALLQTDSRSVGAATNLLVTSKRTISSTATLSQPGATIRSVPAGVALLVTSQRTISNVATLLQTSTHIVSVHASLLVTSMSTISTIGVLKVTGASKAIPVTTSIKTLSNARSVSVHMALLQTETRVVLASATLSTGRAIPCSVALKETFTRTIHATTTLTFGLPPASNAVVYVRSGTAQVTVSSGQAIVHIR